MSAFEGSTVPRTGGPIPGSAICIQAPALKSKGRFLRLLCLQLLFPLPHLHNFWLCFISKCVDRSADASLRLVVPLSLNGVEVGLNSFELRLI